MSEQSKILECHNLKYEKEIEKTRREKKIKMEGVAVFRIRIPQFTSMRILQFTSIRTRVRIRRYKKQFWKVTDLNQCKKLLILSISWRPDPDIWEPNQSRVHADPDPWETNQSRGPCGSGSEKLGGGGEGKPDLAARVGRGNSEVGPQVLSQLSPRLLVMHDDGPEGDQPRLMEGDSQCGGAGAESKLPPGAGADIRIAALAPAPHPFYLSKTWRNFIEKIKVAKEVYVNYHNFYPIWVQHASIHVKKY